MKQKLHAIYGFFLLLTITTLSAQTSGIKGMVVEEKTGQPLPGATVTIKGLNKSRVTGVEGTFIFSKIEPGTYELTVTALTYDEKDITEVIVVKDEIATVTVSLTEKNNQLQEVVVKSTKAKVESVKGLLTMQKNSANVSDGISAETIKRTPDKNTSDVLKRISGASIQDNRFVIIRGLNDRYNASFLNGAPLPSSEPDRKAFSFDIFPANMLDNIVITKTATPDMPGDFAGGVVQINTKSVPEKDFQSISVGSGYNTITTFKTERTYTGSGTDWLGFDNGTRAMPSSIPSTDVFNALSPQDRVTVAKSFQSDWALKDSNFKPNTSLQYSIGRHFEFNNKVLGMLFSVTNSKTNVYSETVSQDFERSDPNVASVVTSRFKDKNYSEQVLTGGLANFSFKFNENNSIAFKNIYSINSTDLVIERSGLKDLSDTRVVNSDVRWFTSNRIYSAQLLFDSYLPTAKMRFNLTPFYNDISRSIPNLRRNIYTIANPNSTDPSETLPYAAIANNNGGPDYGGGMFFSENKETLKGVRLDISKKFNLGEHSVNELKIGGFNQQRDRNFYSRQLQYNTYNIDGTFDTSLLNLPNETIFNVANMGQLSPGVNGFTLFDFTKFTDSYTAGSKLNAGYVMLDNRYKKWRLIWGGRMENYTQTLNARLTETEYLAQDNHQTDFLPSANLIYGINSKQNLRFSFYKTLNRPEFRELAPFGFYDFRTQFFTQGNPDLKIAKVQNIDVRYELFPGKGQVFSVSYFNKYFTDPVELQQEVNNKTVTYRNAKSAKNSGMEFEFRSLLSSLFTTDKSTLFDDITLYTNIAIIKSKVDVSNFNAANVDKSRPLQGQSPYVLNAGLQYIGKENGWAVSMNINRVGNRIYYTASEVEPAIWEKARTLLDVQIAKTFYKNKLEAKLNIQNILAQDILFYQNNYIKTRNDHLAFVDVTNYIFTGSVDNANGYDPKKDDVVWRTKTGRTFSLSLTYNF